MPRTSKGVPNDFARITPRLFCPDVEAEIEFCTRVFGGEESVRRLGPDGTLAHALITIGPATVMIASHWPGWPNRAPRPDGGSPVALYIYVSNVDRTVEHALAAGAKLLRPVENQFWGDRTAWIMDPAGHVWTIATRAETTTEKQRRQRLTKIYRQRAGAAGKTRAKKKPARRSPRRR